MKKFYYISQALPNKLTGGSDLLALNLLNKLKKKYKITAISIGSNYCSSDELKLIKNNLKKDKINFFQIKDKISFLKKPITLKNFYNTCYINEKNLSKVEKYLNSFKFKECDIILCFGSASILAASKMKSIKIAIHEDVQDQIFLYREKFNINKFNFYRKIFKILMLKIHFRNYYIWLKKISKNYLINYTFSKYDFNILKSYLKINVLPVPMIFKINRKNYFKEKFYISMFSSHMAQDYNGIKILNDKLIPYLKSKDLLNKCKFNLVMRIPKKIPKIIKSIISKKIINIKKFDQDIVNKTDLLFYPSRYPVGFRSKILFAFSNSMFVATTKIIKKCIPELKDNINCLMSDKIDELNQKITSLIIKPNKYKHLKKNGIKIVKKYNAERTAKIIIRDISKININQKNY